MNAAIHTRASTVLPLLFLLLLGSCKDRGTEPTQQALPSQLVHTRGTDTPEQTNIYVLDHMGNDRLLVDSAGINNYASWSPDGRKVVFQGNRGRPSEIYVINSDGTGEHNISNNSDFDEHPVWSPDGAWILFESGRTGSVDLWLAHPDGTNLLDITPFPLRDFMGCWSPDGQHVAYVGNHDGGPDIYVTDITAQAHWNITNSPGAAEYAPCWSADGEWIAFIMNRQLFRVAPDGSHMTQMTALDDSLENVSPQWSPNGQTILVQTRGYEIYSVRFDGSNISNLTRNPAKDTSPRWSPDGQWIAFVSDRTPVTQLFLMDAGGANTHQLTFDASGNGMPEWAPR